MYGRTNYAPLSVFVRDEIPPNLIFKESVRPIPPRYPARENNLSKPKSYYSPLTEFNRTPEISTQQRRKPGASEYGVERFSPGTRVSHAMFGEGVIESAKDMGGDVLYEVNFDSVGKKKLMATFAKLKKL